MLPLLYTEHRQLAAAQLAHERVEQTLTATELVHAAYLRLVGEPQFAGRGHFFAAAETMRRIRVESARRKHAIHLDVAHDEEGTRPVQRGAAIA